MQSNIKNLIIDLGVVLIDLNRTRCIEEFKKLGVENIDTMVDVCHHDDIFNQFEKGDITPKEFRDKIRTLSTKKLTDAQIDTAWNAFLETIPAYKLDFLLHLRKHYMVYLLSNTNAIHWNWICKKSFAYKGFRAKDFFEEMFLSFELHQAKPDKDIFRTLLSETGIKPGETFFIDDSVENCEVANGLGIETYTPGAKEDWRHLFDN